MRYIAIFTLVFLFFDGKLMADVCDIRLSGSVEDGETDDFIYGVDVSISEINSKDEIVDGGYTATTTTDDSDFEFCDLDEDGRYLLVADKEGYATSKVVTPFSNSYTGGFIIFSMYSEEETNGAHSVITGYFVGTILEAEENYIIKVKVKGEKTGTVKTYYVDPQRGGYYSFGELPADKYVFTAKHKQIKYKRKIKLDSNMEYILENINWDDVVEENGKKRQR